jgi:hypothetical protein
MKKVILLVVPLLLNTAWAGEAGLYKERRRINFFADFTYNSNSIKTQQSSSTLSASTTSTFTAAELGVDYFFHQKIAASAQVLFVLTSDINAEITGFDAGLRYYPWSKGYQSEITLLDSKVETIPGWSSFIYGGFSSRNLQFNNTSLSFQGIEIGPGIDYHFKQRYFVRGGLNYQRLQNTTSRSLNGFVAGLAVGYAF